MVAAFICDSCRGFDLTALGLGSGEPDHCYGMSDRPTAPGALGGFRCSCPCRDWQTGAVAVTGPDEGSPGAHAEAEHVDALVHEAFPPYSYRGYLEELGARHHHALTGILISFGRPMERAGT